MRVALVGYGAVASVHARALRQLGATISAVCGPNQETVKAFAAEHAALRWCSQLADGLCDADAVIVASPSALHAAQAAEALAAGVHTLVEFPPCSTVAEAQQLWQRAETAGVVLQCAHTSRYVEPYRRLRAWIHEGRLGEIRCVDYLRHLVPRQRSWIDDALLHHAAHPLDLLLYWFSLLRPRGAVVRPVGRPAEDVALVAELSNGAPASISISYSSSLSRCWCVVVGSRCTVSADGFSNLQSDDPALAFTGSPDEVYEAAIRAQDAAFVQTCRGEGKSVGWERTMELITLIDQYRQMSMGDG